MKTPGRLNGKVVIVTGSDSGLGKAMAHEFCLNGATIVLNGRNPAKVKEAEEQFLMMGYTVIGVVADVTVFADCLRLVQTTVVKFGKLDALITNAGITMNERFEDLDAETFKLVMDSQILGTAFPIKAALPEIKKTKGSIVLISSIGAMIGLPTVSAYCAGKMALTGLAESLRVESIDTGIHIGVIYVSFTENDPLKKMVKAGGKLEAVTPRPKWVLQTQQSVARAVTACVYHRRRVKVLSFIGNLVYILTALFPRLSNRLVCWWFSRKKG